jgi:hypothetical protein
MPDWLGAEDDDCLRAVELAQSCVDSSDGEARSLGDPR